MHLILKKKDPPMEKMKKRKRSKPSVNQANMLVEIDGVLHILQKRKQQPEVFNIIELKNTLREQRKKGCIQILKDNGLWEPIFGTLKFLVHFGIVMGLLFCGAWVFMQLEEPHEDSHEHTTNNSLANTTYFQHAETPKLWEEVQQKYGVDVPPHLHHDLIADVKKVIEKRRQHRAWLERRSELSDREFVWMKWFYFTVITTTTIGYGDIFPTTEYGQIFYIVFSIIGISTMMTLLKACGEILSLCNKKMYGLVNRYICGDGEGGCVGQEALSLITMIMFFIAFMAGTIWYDTTAVRPHYDRPIIHVVYYWMYTLTTVGFGTPIDLRNELQHVYQLVLLRIFGLAFLAGVVDAVAVYVAYRKELFDERARVFRFPNEADGLAQIQEYESGDEERDDVAKPSYSHSYRNSLASNG